MRVRNDCERTEVCKAGVVISSIETLALMGRFIMTVCDSGNKAHTPLRSPRTISRLPVELEQFLHNTCELERFFINTRAREKGFDRRNIQAQAGLLPGTF